MILRIFRCITIWKSFASFFPYNATFTQSDSGDKTVDEVLWTSVWGDHALRIRRPCFSRKTLWFGEGCDSWILLRGRFSGNIELLLLLRLGVLNTLLDKSSGDPDFSWAASTAMQRSSSWCNSLSFNVKVPLRQCKIWNRIWSENPKENNLGSSARHPRKIWI